MPSLLDIPVASAAGEFVTRQPAAALRPFVSHYWLARHNTDAFHTVLPDGALDIVAEISETEARSWVYGTTTSPAEAPLAAGRHYLGIRLRAGAGPHFVHAGAHELTDTHEAAAGLLRVDWNHLLLPGVDTRVFAALDHILLDHLGRLRPAPGRTDHAVRCIEAACGAVRMEDLARDLGTSRRQLERQFLTAVGVPPKLFASIVRARYAAALISSDARLGLADAAADTGYTDQSHMTREFRRLFGLSPARLARRGVAFLQDR